MNLQVESSDGVIHPITACSPSGLNNGAVLALAFVPILDVITICYLLSLAFRDRNLQNLESCTTTGGLHSLVICTWVPKSADLELKLHVYVLVHFANFVKPAQ